MSCLRLGMFLVCCDGHYKVSLHLLTVIPSPEQILSRYNHQQSSTMASNVPAEQKALFIPAKHEKFVVGSWPTSKPGPNQILVRQEAVGLNPLDGLMQSIGLYVAEYPAVVGCEGAGVVLEVGPGVTSFAVGDRV